MVVGFSFVSKLLRGINGDVDLPSQPILRLAQRWRDVCETSSANDHQIHVTRRMFPAPRHGTVYKGTLNLVPKRLQHLLQDRGESCGFFEELLQVSKHWRLGLRFEIGTCAFTTVHQYSAFDQG